jgi:hypothetical protein
MISILIAGHSHSACLGLVRMDGGEPRIEEMLSTPTLSVHGLSYCWPTPFLPDFLPPHIAGKHLVLIWQGNHAQSKFNLVVQRQFDFVSSGLPGVPLTDDAWIVPESLVEAALDPSAGDLAFGLGRIMQGNPASVTVVGPPPPKRDEDFIRSQLVGDAGVVKGLAELGLDAATVGITAASVRLKAWELLTRLHAGAARRHGASFLHVPPASQDEDGYLLAEYWHDVTHANRKYGPLLLDAIIAHVSELATQGVST